MGFGFGLRFDLGLFREMQGGLLVPALAIWSKLGYLQKIPFKERMQVCERYPGLNDVVRNVGVLIILNNALAVRVLM